MTAATIDENHSPALDGFESGPVDVGVIGNRHLVAVQTFDVSRLTTNPVPLVPGTFIAVSGSGPKGDSNGSGKTSFLAAISLLLGDAQWRLEANGSQDTPKLLFSPASAGLPSDSGFAPASTGYVVGVFAEDHEDPEATAITVWLRISATPQHLKVRWTHGLHVADGASDLERYEQADALWRALPRENEVGPKTMRQVLYGTAPRAIAYVDTSMRKAAPSLLSQQMTEMTPEQIGVALIELTGRQGLLDTEEEQRGLLATQEAELRTQQEQDRVTRALEDDDLAEVNNRGLARTLLADGERFWRLHFARGYLDVLGDDERLRVTVEELEADLIEARRVRDESQEALDALLRTTDLADAEEAAKTAHSEADARSRAAALDRDRAANVLRERTTARNGLRAVADRWTGTPVADLEVALVAAEATKDKARYDLRDADRGRADAQRGLDAARAGGGGESGNVLGLLTDAGVEARLLLDEVTLAPQARGVWEPRLWPHRHAVVVAPAEAEAAYAALAGTPGATVVVADGGWDTTPQGLPAGVEATIPVAGFLSAIAERTEFVGNPDRAVDVSLGEHVVGGFAREIAGRAARIAAAEALLGEAQAAYEQAERVSRTATAAWEATVEDLEAGRAAAEVTVLTDQIGDLDEQVRVLTDAASARDAEVKAAHGALVAAAANARAYHDQVSLARQQVRVNDTALTAATVTLREKTNERNNLRVSYWATEWGDTPEAAERLLDEQEEPIRSLQRRSLRHRSAELLKDALDAYRRNLSEVPAPLAEAIRQRQLLADNEPGVGRDTVSFESVASPLRDLLDQRSDTDLLLADRIMRQRTERETRIAAMEAETREKQEQWGTVQDMIGGRIEEALNKISTSLNRLVTGRGGYGAKLKIVETRPVTPTSTWKWEVTPQWKRSASGDMVDYKKVANGAQVKVFAIQLVLAALLADEGAKGRVLIVDELGNSLGDVHRKDVLRDLNEVAADQDVTIIGTCQDSVIADAAGQCGEILWFSHENAADAYNQPTRMWGYDPHGQRVTMVADWLTAGRSLV